MQTMNNEVAILGEELQTPKTLIDLLETKQESFEKQLAGNSDRITIVEQQLIDQPLSKKDKDEEDLGPLPQPDNSDLSKRIDALEVQHVLVQKQTQETNTMVTNFQKPFAEIRDVVGQITTHLQVKDGQFTGGPRDQPSPLGSESKEPNPRGEEEKD